MTGTLYEGGTRGIGFIHSPLLENTGYTSVNLMHAVDWLPTLMTAIGRPGLATSATDGNHHHRHNHRHHHHHHHHHYHTHDYCDWETQRQTVVIIIIITIPHNCH